MDYAKNEIVDRVRVSRQLPDDRKFRTRSKYVANPKVTAEKINMKNNMHLILIQENIPSSSLLLLCNDRLDDFLK